MKTDLTPWGFFRGLRGRSQMDDPFLALQNEMNQLFEAYGAETPALWGSNGHTFVPSMDISETDKEYHVRAELPGVDEKDIQLQLNQGVLTLKGEKRSEKEEKDKGYYRKETSCGSFMRRVALPGPVVTDAVSAKFQKGILDILIKKQENKENSARRIPIQS